MLRKIVKDLILWIIAAVICILWRVIASKSGINAYWVLFAGMAGVWIVLSLVFGKYRSYKERWFWQEILSLAIIVGVEIGLSWYVLPHLHYGLSPVVAGWTVGIVAMMDALLILLAHYWKYAQNLTVPVMPIEKREKADCKRTDEKRSEASVEAVHQSVLSLTTEEEYQLLLKKAHLDSRQTKVVASRDRFSFLQIPDYQYKTLVDLMLLNEAKGINKRFCIVNQKLPDNGIYVCCYRPQEYIKKKILDKYPKGLNWVVYSFWFFIKRVIPRLMLSSRLYYDLTKGRKRMLSRTEVLGRLYYCGFEVLEEIPSGHIVYVFARRHSQPYPQEQIKLYGPLIKLARVGKDKEIVYFYKMRTMHPYAEYIQKFVFDKRGGMSIADKSEDDFRITTWGRFLRKYWLDELPMLINWIKRDCKLVGVRPLSRTMFEQYPKELQDKRTQCKPGLIPPFYVNHPDDFESLFASENQYLDEYFAHPVKTDCKYFFLTLRSILFGKMHSA